LRRSADTSEAFAGGDDRAGVEAGEGKAGTRRNGVGEVDQSFGGLAGVVGVGRKGVLGDGKGSGGGEALPMESRGELERELGDRGGRGIADGKAGSSIEMRGRRGEMEVEVPVGEDDGGALGVGDGGDGLFRSAGELAAMGLVLGVFVAMEEDLALGGG
jgi:hypothetical protein